MFKIDFFLYMAMWCHFNGKLCFSTNMDVEKSKLDH